MKTLSKRAYAKVNLVLDVVRRRADGYHEVKMVMQNVGLYDELDFSVDTDYSGKKITIICDKEGVPVDRGNLIYRAIELMFDKYKLSGSVLVRLKKNIPVEAGMAGGSTDCAAAIRAVNELYELGADTGELMELGVRLGADVPYCILGKTALSQGIGEILTPVCGLEDCFVLIAKPPVGVSTKTVYSGLCVEKIESHPKVDEMVQALESRQPGLVAEYMDNVLETVTVGLHKEIQVIKDIMKENGAMNAIMSGSGPTVFGLFKDEQTAHNAGDIIKKSGLSEEVYVTVPINS